MRGMEATVADLDRMFLRKLAEWQPDGVPVTSVYLGVDGRSMPRKQDYELRLEDLLRRVREQAGTLSQRARRSVECDAGRIRDFVRGAFVRAGNRGLAMFSANGAGLWETVAVPRPVPNRAVRRHDQGGWAQARLQRHADDLRRKHLRRTAEAVFRLSRRRPFDHLVLGGPDEVAVEFEQDLHDYLRRKVRARVTLPVTATTDEVLRRTLALEEKMLEERQRRVVARLSAGRGAGHGAVSGLIGTLAALSDGRAETLVVADGFAEPGVECPECGWLAEWGETCRSCGSATRRVADVVEAAVARAFRSGCGVEIVTGEGALDRHGRIGA